MRHRTSQPLSNTDYKNLLARANSRELQPLVARNHYLRFQEKESLIGDTQWGRALLAIHNKDAYFANEELVNKLREDADSATEDNDGPSTMNALALSPHEEDHFKVMQSDLSRSGYNNAIQDLASNRHLSLTTAQTLLKNEIEKETGLASSVAYRLTNSSLAPTSTNGHYYEDWNARRKSFKYNDASLTEEHRNELRNEITKLRPAADNSFVSPEAQRVSYLTGKLYANDSDYRALKKDYARAVKDHNKANLDEAKKVKKYKLGWDLKQAENYRESLIVLEFINRKVERLNN